MSASSKTIKGACPPNSKATFLTVGAHCAIKIRPTSVDPVKERWRMVGEAQTTLPIAMDWSASAGIMLTTPAGIPARCANSAKAKAHKGVCSAGLITMVQPAAIAGAILRVIIAIGKFHGVIATHTPIACFRTSMRLSPQVLSRMAPVTRFDSSANHSTNEAP